MATIRRRGDKWQVQVRRLGQRSISKTFLIKKDAEAWARHTEVQADKHELPTAQQDRRLLERITLGELVERYRDTVTPSKRGKDVEHIILNAFLRDDICSKRLSEISTLDFVAYRDRRLQKIKPGSLKRQLAPIHNLFEVARTEWLLPIKENPVAQLQLGGSTPHRERRLKPGEFLRLVQAAQSRQSPYLLPIMRFALATGMRRGEILAMCWEHLDRNDNSLLIPHTKNGHARIIPISRDALSVLDGLREQGKETGRIFPTSANAFRLCWERTKASAGINDLRFHDLRHEAISRFFEAGLSVPEVALISGHRDPRMLFRYTHPARQVILDKLEKDQRRTLSKIDYCAVEVGGS